MLPFYLYLLSLTFIYHLLSCVFAMILLPSNRQYLLVRASCRSPYTGAAPPQRSSAQNCQVGSLSRQKLGRGRKWKQLSTKNVSWEKVGGLFRGKSEKLQQKMESSPKRWGKKFRRKRKRVLIAVNSFVKIYKTLISLCNYCQTIQINESVPGVT